MICSIMRIWVIPTHPPFPRYGLIDKGLLVGFEVGNKCKFLRRKLVDFGALGIKVSGNGGLLVKRWNKNQRIRKVIIFDVPALSNTHSQGIHLINEKLVFE